MYRGIILRLLVISMVVAGCAGTGMRQVPPEKLGMQVDIQQLVERSGSYEIYASTDRAVTTSLVFDLKEDPYDVLVQGKLWQSVEDQQELLARIEEMRWAFRYSNQVKAVTAPDETGQAAALVYSPNPVRVSRAGPETVEVDVLYMEDACRGIFQFGSGPCLELDDTGF